MASVVYMASMACRAHSQNKAVKVASLCDALGLKDVLVQGKPCAVKLHFGEDGCDTYLHPTLVRAVVDKIREAGANPFLTDTTTLYSGSRHNAVDHINTAIRHGFGPGVVDAPVVIADGLFGENDVEVPIKGKHFDRVLIASEIVKAPSMVVLSHFKGHQMGGFGGAIKNLAMGCASQRGKEEQHACKVFVEKGKCVGCGSCVSVCPQQAMGIGDDGLCSCDQSKCIGCFECMTVCPQGAVELDWETEMPAFTERLTEYGFGAAKCHEGRICFINFVMNVTPDCDCAGWSDAPMIPDVGMLASFDPVALDQACFDLVQKAAADAGIDLQGKDLFTRRWPQTCGWRQLEHGEALGMGSRAYEIKML